MEQAISPDNATIGDLRRLSVTLPQAAHVLDVDVREVRKAVDRRVVAATFTRQGNRQIRTLNGVDLLCLRLGKIFKNNVREHFCTQISEATDRQMLRSILDGRQTTGQMSYVSVAPLVFETAIKTISDIGSLRSDSEFIDADGRILGTDVEAHRIAALVGGGMGIDQVVEDYPNLAAVQVAAAVRFAEANPKAGRPYPARTAKSVLRGGGGGGLAEAFAAVSDDEEDA